MGGAWEHEKIRKRKVIENKGITRLKSIYLGSLGVLLQAGDGDHLLTVRLLLGQLDVHPVVIPANIRELDSIQYKNTIPT